MCVCVCVFFSIFSACRVDNNYGFDLFYLLVFLLALLSLLSPPFYPFSGVLPFSSTVPPRCRCNIFALLYPRSHYRSRQTGGREKERKPAANRRAALGNYPIGTPAEAGYSGLSRCEVYSPVTVIYLYPYLCLIQGSLRRPGPCTR